MDVCRGLLSGVAVQMGTFLAKMDNRGMAHVPNRCADRNDDRYSQTNPLDAHVFAFTVDSFALRLSVTLALLSFLFTPSRVL